MQMVSNTNRPLVLCEGETDVKYFETAANLLGGFKDILEKVDFRQIGINNQNQTKHGGEGQLKKVQKMLEYSPEILKTPTILLFDCDQKGKVSESDGKFLHVWVLEKNEGNGESDGGIENLLPPEVLEDRFFNTKEWKNGPNTTTKKTLNKVELCDYLCEQKHEAADFEGFRPALEKIRDCLFPETA